MAEHDPNDELSVEELEDVAGGTGANAGCTVNGNCPCSSDSTPGGTDSAASIPRDI